MDKASVKKCRVKFVLTTQFEVGSIYLCGATANAGGWDAAKATAMKHTEEGWVCIKYLPVGCAFEYKFLAGSEWEKVEKGLWFEEIGNRVCVAEKGLVVVGDVPHFAK